MGTRLALLRSAMAEALASVSGRKALEKEDWFDRISLSMKQTKWLIIAVIVAVLIGLLLVKFWNLLVGICAGVALLLVLFAFVLSAGRGLLWDNDEDEEDDDDDDDDDHDDHE